jgi:peptidoglycan hydrolase CwlO-like protein
MFKAKDLGEYTKKLTIFISFILIISIINFLPAEAQLTPERRAQLEAELSKVEREIEQNKALLSSKQQETASIARDVDILTYQINQAKLNIRAKELEISRLGGDINKRVVLIGELSDKIEEEKTYLAELLRKTRELDQITPVEVILANDSLSGMFSDLDSFNFIQSTMHQSFAVIRNNQNQASLEKVSLETKRSAEIDARKVIETEKANIERIEKEKQNLLRMSKSEEAVYQQVLADRERERAAIRSALFELRDTTAIPFGQAVDLALAVEKQTGVRAAFILAIITQESNLGQNVGTCNRPNDPLSKSWRKIMPGPEADRPSSRDDQTVYLRLMKELGFDPDVQPLSCPYGGGWGGAMGPSQFIPTTWEPYKSRISTITGNNPPSPWRPVDAFTASGLLLRDLGAAAGGYTNERRAALRYYAGGNWNKPANAFYGDSVMRIATNIQNQINILQNN